jgi:hypothetical protein
MIIDKLDETTTASKLVSASVSEKAKCKDKFPREMRVDDTVLDFKSSCTINNFEPEPCRTYIFTFDSLGGRHQTVIRKLSAYLEMEALDKKKIVNFGNVGSKAVPVCSQASFWSYVFF